MNEKVVQLKAKRINLPEDTALSDVLSAVQRNLYVPKTRYNKFGDFYYRNVDDINHALKQILPEFISVNIKDEIVQIGERYYVKATAQFSSKTHAIETTGWAREPVSRPKMDESMCTGSSSSYARKYALNGLFLIDDAPEIDSDSTEGTHIGRGETPKVHKNAPPELPSEAHKMLYSFLRDNPQSNVLFKQWLQDKGKQGLLALTEEEAKSVRLYLLELAIK